MIITCGKCDKKFDIDSAIIPEKGRLLQCSGCNHKWFFKNFFLNQTDKPTIINKPAEKKIPIKNEVSERIKLLDNRVNFDNVVKKNLTNKKIKNDYKTKIKAIKDKKKYNLLSLTIIFIISFIALIIIADTFKGPIGKIVPDIEFVLYNLYESITDVILFFKDII